MNNIYADEGQEYPPPEIVPTNHECEDCGQLLVKWTEGNGDDYRNVYWCENCKERFDE